MIGKILGNRYEIVEKVGGGGMALVYRAKCNLLNRFVAVKILRPEFTNDKDLIDKFKRESQSAASLSHPNVVNIYDVGEDEEIYYIVMEYVAGKTLKEVIKEKGKLSPEEIIDYSRQISFALRHAHHNHIIHRDIKPHNILITADGRAKVTDFGIALAASSSTMTNAGSVIGSVHYFSPEQARGGYTDEKSDLYSLGIVMYEMATGRVPFEGDSPITVALKHIQDQPKLPTELNPELPKSIENVIIKLMSKEQSSRYQNTEELLEELSKLKNNPYIKPFQPTVNEEDSPTQIIPVISEEDLQNKGSKYSGERNIVKEKEEEESPKKNKKVKKTIVASAIVAALIAALLFSFGFYYFGNFFRTSEVEIPEFVGMERGEAEALAETLNLQLNIDERYNDEVEANHIISQNPPEGRRVKTGYTVKVVVSLGLRETEVPDLVHENEADAPYLLTNANLSLGNVDRINSNIPAGSIISQDPRAGFTVAQGTPVDIVVSLGPEKVVLVMPNLKGEQLEVATRTLQELGLRRGNIREEYSDEFAANQVINQSVPPTTEVEENTTVDLVVSQGPRPVDTTPIETPPTDNGNGDDDDDNDDANTVGTSTKSISINLREYTGEVEIEIFAITSTGKKHMETSKHHVERDGQYASFDVSGSGRQVIEVHVNGKQHGNQIVINF